MTISLTLKICLTICFYYLLYTEKCIHTTTDKPRFDNILNCRVIIDLILPYFGQK